MNKEFNYLTCKERYGLIQSTLTSFVAHPSAPIVDIVDGKVNPRQELLGLIDFEALQMNPAAYDKVKAVLTEKVLSEIRIIQPIQMKYADVLRAVSIIISCGLRIETSTVSLPGMN